MNLERIAFFFNEFAYCRCELAAFLSPFLDPLDIEGDAFRSGLRIEMAHDCQEPSISLTSRISNHHAVEWFLLGASASQPDTYSHPFHFPLTSVLVVHTYITSLNVVKTIIPSTERVKDESCSGFPSILPLRFDT